MIKRIVPLISIILSGSALTQVGIGIKKATSSTQLEIKAIKKGVLLPRVELENKNTFSPIEGDRVESLLVYHIGNSSLKAGFYYWKNNAWTPLLSGETYVDRMNNTFVIGENPTKNNEDSLIITDIENHSVYLAVADIANNQDFITKFGDNTTFKTLVKNNSDETNLTFKDGATNPSQIQASFTYNNGKSTTVVQFEETLTELEKGVDAKQLTEYYFIDEIGNRDAIAIQVSQDISNDFGKIIADNSVKTLLQQFLSTASGNISVVRNTAGHTVITTPTAEFNLTEEIKINIVLTDLGSGFYVYRNEGTIKNNTDGIRIDIVSDIQNNFQEII